MRVVPKRQQDKLRWCRVRVGPWTEHAEAIGTSGEMMAAFADEVEAARAALAEAARARAQARSATLAAKAAVAKMHWRAAHIVKQVRAQAEASDDVNIYALASIPAPASASPIAAPGKPYGFGVELLGDGSLRISWSCKHPAGSEGVLYEVRRRVVTARGVGEPVFVAMVGKKRFHDKRPPVAGASMFIYEIRAVRSTKRGPIATFNVNFGTPAPGSAAPGIAPGISGDEFIPRGEAGRRSAA